MYIKQIVCKNKNRMNETCMQVRGEIGVKMLLIILRGNSLQWCQSLSSISKYIEKALWSSLYVFYIHLEFFLFLVFSSYENFNQDVFSPQVKKKKKNLFNSLKDLYTYLRLRIVIKENYFILPKKKSLFFILSKFVKNIFFPFSEKGHWVYSFCNVKNSQFIFTDEKSGHETFFYLLLTYFLTIFS